MLYEQGLKPYVMTMIYIHVLHHFYAYYLPHLMLLGVISYVFAEIRLRAQIG